MADIAAQSAPDKPPGDVCRDPTLLRAVLGLLATADVQRTQIALLETRLAKAEHAIELLEAEQERERMR